MIYKSIPPFDTCVSFCGRAPYLFLIQPRSATKGAATSIGFLKPRHLGLLLIKNSILAICSSLRQFSIERERPIVKPESARALWIFAIILAVAGSAIPSPSGRFFFSVVAALVALPPAIFGAGRARLGGTIACIFSLVQHGQIEMRARAAWTERSESQITHEVRVCF